MIYHLETKRSKKNESPKFIPIEYGTRVEKKAVHCAASANEKYFLPLSTNDVNKQYIYYSTIGLFSYCCYYF